MSHYPAASRAAAHPMTLPAISKTKKKTAASSSKVDPIVLKKRRDTIEQRIARLEGKLAKDRALLLRYAEVAAQQEAADPASE